MASDRQNSNLIGSALALAVTTLCLQSCGEMESNATETSLRDSQRVQTVTLVPTTPSRADDKLHFVGNVPIPEEVALWSSEGCEPFVRDLPPGSVYTASNSDETERVFVLPGTESKTLRIPGRFLGTSFNVVSLRLSVFQEETVFIQFMRDGKPALTSNAMSIKGSREPQVLMFPLPHARLQQEPFDELSVRIDGRGGILAIHDVEFYSRPISSWLPDPSLPADLIAVENDLRRGVGLSNFRGLRGEFTAPESGGFLSFSLGVPSALRYPAGAQIKRPSVRVELEGATGGRVERRFNLRETAQNARWQHVRVPLENFSKEQVQVNLTLEASRELEALCAVGDVRVHTPSHDSPSVVLITSDTHRADHLGAAKQGVDILTPNLDSLADRGVFFENCYTATNVTNPSHIALMTAVHPRDTMILNNYRPLVEEASTLAEQFREAGYATIAVLSANHLGHEGSGLGQGFDRMYRPKAPQTDAKHSIDVLEYYLREYEDTPVFVWLHTFDAHTPYAPPAPYDDLYYSSEADPFDPSRPDPEVPERINEQFFSGLKDMEFPSSQYRGEITYLDDQLRRVFDNPRFADGIIAFTADHGECIGHHGIFYDHASLYPSSIHVPLILSYPGCPEGLRVGEAVEQINVGRTLLEIAGLETAEFPGTSLLDFTQPGAAEREAPRFAVAAHGFSASLNHGKWHLILHLRQHENRAGITGPYKKGETELYDTDLDPNCTMDLLEENFEVAKELRARLIEWLLNADPRGLAGSETNDAQTIRQLAALGYTMHAQGNAAAALWEAETETEWCRRFR